MREYSIGLDIGIASVGWACISPDYKVLKYNGRNAIGVHEFESAKVAAERRTQRSTRRRYNRRKKRIQLLQSLFTEHMTKYPDFFSTHSNEHFWANDNQFEHRTMAETLNSMGLNTKHFPTQYHLRNYLLNTNEKEDLRFIYLALHHLVKYRGHFLNDNIKWGANVGGLDLTVSLNGLLEHFAMLNELQYVPRNQQELDEIKEILLDTQQSRADRNKLLKSTLSKEFEPFFKLALGLDITAEKLFSKSENAVIYKESKLKIKIASDDFDLQLNNLLEVEAQFLESFQVFYQQLTLQDLLGDASTVAHAKVRAYEEFEVQLAQLKQIVDKYAGEQEYRALFITPKRNLTAFRNKPDVNLLCLFDRYLKNKKSEEAFFKKVKDLLDVAKVKANGEDGSIIHRLSVLLENGQLLLKQRSSHNAAIPYQNNVFEAQQIIKKQQAHYPFMTDEWLEKVVQIISFRIPYYIGPLGNSEFAWMMRSKEQNITPWNFDEVVDKASSAQGFIERMTNNCTYLKEEKVLPKHSLLYEKFELLNELNGIQLRTKKDPASKKNRLDEDVKKWVIREIFQKHKTVTHAKFLTELKKFPQYAELDLEDKQLFGTAKEDRFVASLQSHLQFKELIEAYGEEVTEQVIYYLTVFNEREIIVKKLQEEFPQMKKEHIERFSKVSLTGWGRLSKKLLNELVVTDEYTVIQYMEKFPDNFMEVQSQTNLKHAIANYNPKHSIKKITYQDIQQLAGSPALKRSIWRAVKIVEELTAIFGEPTNIMVEVAREVQVTKRPKSNKQRWQELGKEWVEQELKQFYAEHANYAEDKYRDKRFWLYLTQHGKCLYSGEKLHIEELSNYEVDHIFPRSFVVDDSYNNLALVKSKYNQEKGNTKTPLQVIPENKRRDMIAWWESLQERHLITPQKYNRLIKLQFDDADKEAFFSRQLVETRQIITNVKDLLQERFADTKVHLVNAKIVSKFRSALKIPKNRDYNNKHHAIDAFLTTLLIQYIEQKFGENFLAFSFKQKDREAKWKQIMLSAQKKEDFFVFKHFQEEKIMSVLTQQPVGAVKYVEEVVYELPWQTTKKTGSSEGMFYDASIYSPKSQEAKYMSPKTDRFVHKDIKTATTYCIKYIVEKKGKQKEECKLFDLKVIDHYQLPKESIAMVLVQREVKDVVLKAEILYELPKYQKILWDGHEYYFATSSELHNAKQWVVPKHLVEVLNSKDLLDYQTKQLKQLFEEVCHSFFEQFPIFDHKTFRGKVENFKNGINNLENFNTGVKELFRSAAANATRSELFGSRLAKKANPQELKVIYESITGLKYRKPKPLRSFEQTPKELVRS